MNTKRKAAVIVVLGALCFCVKEHKDTNTEPAAKPVRGEEEFDTDKLVATVNTIKASSLADVVAEQFADGIDKPKKAEVKASSLAETKDKADANAEIAALKKQNAKLKEEMSTQLADAIAEIAALKNKKIKEGWARERSFSPDGAVAETFGSHL